MKKIWVITLFPEYFEAFKEVGVAGKTLRGERGSIEFNTVLLSNYSSKSFKGCDAAPYGGGPGMVMRGDVLEAALQKGVVEKGGYSEDFKSELHVVYTGPRGYVWNNRTCKAFASTHYSEDGKDLVFICGRYEGIDERFLEQYVDETISLGDFVLTGGELAVMTILDSSLRFLDGILSNKESAVMDSFEDDLIEHPQYTRPSDLNGSKVPDILMSGNHKLIEEYRHKKKVEMTKIHRPDLYEKYKGNK